MRRHKVLAPVRPNVGLERAYQRQINAEIAAMGADVRREISKAWRDNPPRMAQDAVPANDLNDVMSGLRRKWTKRFDILSQRLARHFSKQVAHRSDAALRSALRKGGFTVEFKLTPQQVDILNATTHENVALIKSIPEQHLTQVQGAVMRSVTAGRDLQSLHEFLTHELGVTKRRASLIARDQNNKATAAYVRNRQDELGLRAIWLHSAGGKTPRPSHVAQSGKEYDPKTGWYDPDAKEFCWPGSLINCRCVSKTVLPLEWST